MTFEYFANPYQQVFARIVQLFILLDIYSKVMKCNVIHVLLSECSSLLIRGSRIQIPICAFSPTQGISSACISLKPHTVQQYTQMVRSRSVLIPSMCMASIMGTPSVTCWIKFEVLRMKQSLSYYSSLCPVLLAHINFKSQIWAVRM